jgi:hypothetical protein
MQIYPVFANWDVETIGRKEDYGFDEIVVRIEKLALHYAFLKDAFNNGVPAIYPCMVDDVREVQAVKNLHYIITILSEVLYCTAS